MSALVTLLEEIETALNTIIELDTVEIATEKGINARSCPAVRIVPVRRSIFTKMPYLDNGTIKIIILLDLKNKASEQTKESIIMEERVREVLKGIINYQDTEYDQDSVTVFKATILTYSFGNIPNTRTECENELS